MKNKKAFCRSPKPRISHWLLGIGVLLDGQCRLSAQEKTEVVRPKPEEVVVPEGLDEIAAKQHVAIQSMTAPWGYWGTRPDSYSSWTNHSNRLIPVYVFGGNLEA